MCSVSKQRVSEGEKARSLLKWKTWEDMEITHHCDARGGCWLRLSLWRGLLGAHHADDDNGDKSDDYNDAHDGSEDEEAD